MTAHTLPTEIRPNYFMIVPKLVAFVVMFGSLVVLAGIFKLLRIDGLRARACRWAQAAACVALRVKVIQEGEHSAMRPMLLVTNHCSYLDIFVLGGAIKLCFTPKSEIRTWPIVNTMCHISDCIFIERKRESLEKNRAAMREKLDQNKVVCLFPEGTTSNGLTLLPFKSSFFSLAEMEFDGRRLWVQPATLMYTHINGVPVTTPEKMDWLAWYGDMMLVPHFLRFLSMRSVTVKIVWHPVVTLAAFESRKELSRHCEEQVGAPLKKLVG